MIDDLPTPGSPMKMSLASCTIDVPVSAAIVLKYDLIACVPWLAIWGGGDSSGLPCTEIKPSCGALPSAEGKRLIRL